MSSKQLIFDVETLGTESNSVCLQASFLVYDIAADYDISIADLRPRVKTFKLSVEDQVAHKRAVDNGTLDFWKNEIAKVPELKYILKRDHENDLTMLQFYDELYAWLIEQEYDRKKDWAWQRGTLDIAILDSMWKDLNISRKDFPIFWWKIRDLRTAIDLFGDTDMNGYIKGIKENGGKYIDGFKKHNSVDDILLEVLQLRMIGLYHKVE
jgi:hypothetical protein